MFTVVLKDLLTNIWNFESTNIFMFSAFFGLPIDRFKKFARLGTSLLISDAITSKREANAHMTTLQNRYTLFKDENPDYANSAIAPIFSISE